MLKLVTEVGNCKSAMHDGVMTQPVALDGPVFNTFN